MPSLLHDLMLATAASTPQRTAIVAGERCINYEQLAKRATQIAAWLESAGVGPGSRVGLLAHKDIECYEAIYGILMAGCAYVPLDRRAPAERIEYIFNDCEISTIIATGKGMQPLLAKPDSMRKLSQMLVLDDMPELEPPPCAVFGPADLPASSVMVRAHVVDTDLAYVLYTSGSTGRPKGVMISHGVSMSFVRWAANHTNLEAADRVSGHAPLHFDLSIFDIYATAKVGAALYPVADGTSTFPAKLTEWMIRNRITVWYSVPSILSMMSKQASFRTRRFPDLRLLLFAGEVFPIKYLKEWLRVCPDTKFMNWYGPTETNVITSYTVDVSAEEIDKPLPIGKATANADLLRVDDAGDPIRETQQVGELLARGPCVALGYWDDNDRTQEKFVANARMPWLRERVYKTGDLVALDGSGNYHYVGRADHQIKCRGYRIELGEIETALYRDKSVQEAAVIPLPDDLIGNRLIAFIALDEPADKVPDHVIDSARSFLPSYMMPQEFIVLPELPKTSNGKTDRQKLLQQAKKST